MLNKVGGYALIIIGGIAVFSLPVVFLMGAVWASLYLIPVLFRVVWCLVGLTVFIALPLAMRRKMRRPVATAIMYSSLVYGVTAWLLGLVLTYIHWGIFAVALGLFTAFLGVIPIGLLASALNGWEGFVPLVSLVALTFGSWITGIFLESSAQKNARLEWENEPECELMEKARAVAELGASIEREGHLEDANAAVVHAANELRLETLQEETQRCESNVETLEVLKP